MEPDATISEKPQAAAATGKNFTRIPFVEFIDGLLAESESATVTMMQYHLTRTETLLAELERRSGALPGMNGREEAQPTDRLESDKALDIKQLAIYMGVSVNWIHKHSHELPRIQSGKRGRLRFRRSEIDSYLKKHSTPGIPD